MSITAARIARDYVVIATFALIAGFASMVISWHVRERVSQQKKNWPQRELRVAASAALAFQKDHGRLPWSLSELSTSQSDKYLPHEFDLKGVMYFRDEGGRPRPSWRDDVERGVAYCSLEAALDEHC